MHQNPDPGNRRCELLQNLHPLPPHGGLEIGKPGDVAARPREARHETAADRIGDHDEHDGDIAGEWPQLGQGGVAEAQDDVRLQCHELRCLGSHQPEITVGPANDDFDIVALAPPEFLEPVQERVQSGGILGLLADAHQRADAANSVRRARNADWRDAERCAKEGNQFPPVRRTYGPGFSFAVLRR
ncbi:MAG: hypothetical protein JO213_08255 [Alphaproteobacteria bacterium]|nr:hypothetical protein [Alphaproteobacteria bacterium]MBV9965210.1 hypothetical protein [Alphaproteobacteria bacterium]